MFIHTKVKYVIISLLISMGFVSYTQACNAEKIADKKLIAENNEARILCYAPPAPTYTPEQNLDDYKMQLKSLEKLYNESKIDKDTYELRKSDLNNKILELENNIK